jgi:ABC-type Fe3+-hydroxamate transport system substrate-binding protein
METKIVGRWDRPDRESVLRADPELILGVNWASLTTDTYRNVAPTITLFNKDNWRDTLLELATLFGKKEQYAAWLKQYDHKAADARSRLRSSFGQEQTVMLLVDAGKEWREYGGKRQLGDILYKELKLTPPIGVKPQTHYTVISEEDLARMNPDHIFLTTCNSNSDARLTEQLKSSPAWNTLRAVQNGRLN